MPECARRQGETQRHLAEVQAAGAKDREAVARLTLVVKVIRDISAAMIPSSCSLPLTITALRYVYIAVGRLTR